MVREVKVRIIITVFIILTPLQRAEAFIIPEPYTIDENATIASLKGARSSGGSSSGGGSVVEPLAQQCTPLVGVPSPCWSLGRTVSSPSSTSSSSSPPPPSFMSLAGKLTGIITKRDLRFSLNHSDTVK